MFTQEDDVEIHALAARGWTQSAISRHTGRDRKTVRKYLAAGEVPCAGAGGELLGAVPRRISRRGSSTIRTSPAVRCSTSWPRLGSTARIRRWCGSCGGLELRPVCLVCQQRRGNAPTVEIEHPPGEEIQWDWLELTDTPWGEPAYVLVGALSHSGRFRAVFCEQMTFGHLAGAVHEMLVGLGGTRRVWRTDRMATIVIPGTDRLNPQFAQIAKHYGVEVAVCPPHRPQRKGVVEAAIKFIGGRWWRTAQVGSMREAQQSLDAWTVEVADDAAGRRHGRRARRQRAAAGAARAARSRREIIVDAGRVTHRAGRVRGQPVQRPARLRRPAVTVLARVGEPHLRIVTAHRDRSRRTAAPRRRRADDPHQRARHAARAGGPRRVHDRDRVPAQDRTGRPATSALAELARLHGHTTGQVAPVVSLTDYAALAEVAC